MKGCNQTADTLWESIKELYDSVLAEKTISTRIQLFNGIYKAITDKKESGKTDSDRMQDALDNFEVKTGQPFAFTECWKVLKKMPKFDPMLHQQEGGQANSDENSSGTVNHVGTIGEKFKVISVVSGSFFHVETYADRMGRAKSMENPRYRASVPSPIRAVDERALPQRNRPCL
eukprot:scaffold3534_cov102-Cylindrotheca_fusiformis.AAC.3